MSAVYSKGQICLTISRMELCCATGLALSLISLTVSPALADADPAKGARTFHNQCSPCHSLKPGRHMTGPSLSGIVGRKAGSIGGFERYSKPLPHSSLEWNEQTLSAWLANPQAVVPGNTMTALVADAQDRANIVAYLLATQTPGAPPREDIPKPHEKTLDLKAAGPATRIASIGFCRNTYAVKMENGSTLLFWEQNLRFKTDSSAEGPLPAKPNLVPTGMHGDRSYAVFAAPQEISGFIKLDCPDR
jgi:Cytochrome c2